MCSIKRENNYLSVVNVVTDIDGGFAVVLAIDLLVEEDISSGMDDLLNGRHFRDTKISKNGTD